MDRATLPREIRAVVGGLMELAWPTRCIGCDEPGALLCPECAALPPVIDQATSCRACGAPYGLHVCTECWTGDGPVEHAFSRAACALEFEGLAARLVVSYKDQGERRLAELIGTLVAHAVQDRWGDAPAAVTYVPATPEALRRRGFDHMRPVAAQVAQLLGAPCARLLDKLDSRDQRGLGREERAENMRGSFRAAGEGLQLPAGHVLLVDDVFTTGATLDAASEALLESGWSEVRVATACRVW